MRTQRIATRPGTAAAGCIVLLPGVQQQFEDFTRNRFDAALHERPLAHDLMLVAPELAHLTDRDWLQCLHEQVVQPLRAAGESIWLGGISLGAFMALRFAGRYPAAIDGLCLIAPYLGSRIVAAEIARAAPLQSWQPGVLADDDDERQIWRYLLALRSPRRAFSSASASTIVSPTPSACSHAHCRPRARCKSMAATTGRCGGNSGRIFSTAVC